MSTACTQHVLWAEIKASLQGTGTNKPSQGKGQWWHAVLKRGCDDKGCWNKFQWCGVKCKDCMDINGAAVNALITEEKHQLIKEGKCFTCKRIGHQSCNCPSKENPPKVAHGGACMDQGMSTCAAQVGEKKEDKQKELTKSIQTMTAEEWNELLDNLVLAGFWMAWTPQPGFEPLALKSCTVAQKTVSMFGCFAKIDVV